MSTALDTRIKAVVARLLPKYGKRVTLSKLTAITDPTTGIAAKSTTSATVYATPPEAFDLGFRFNDVVKLGDLSLLVGPDDVNGKALAFTPGAGNTVAFDGQTFEVVSAERIYSGEDLAAYVLQLRGGA